MDTTSAAGGIRTDERSSPLVLIWVRMPFRLFTRRRVTSYQIPTWMTLDTAASSADASVMVRKATSTDGSCEKCDQPAVTFDRSGVPLCSRHAVIFIAVKDQMTHLSEEHTTA